MKLHFAETQDFLYLYTENLYTGYLYRLSRSLCCQQKGSGMEDFLCFVYGEKYGKVII